MFYTVDKLIYTIKEILRVYTFGMGLVSAYVCAIKKWLAAAPVCHAGLFKAMLSPHAMQTASATAAIW